MKETVLKSIFDLPKNRFGYSIEDDFDDFADKLANDFPDKITEYYWQKAYRNIPNGNRKTYSIAAKYLGKAKDIYINILNNEAG